MNTLHFKWFVWLLGDHEHAGALKCLMGALFLKYCPGHLTCRAFERFVLDYHEGKLSGRQRSVFAFHMRICPRCRVHFESYVRAIELGQKLFARDDEALVPEDVPEELIKAILATRASP